MNGLILFVMSMLTLSLSAFIFFHYECDERKECFGWVALAISMIFNACNQLISGNWFVALASMATSIFSLHVFFQCKNRHNKNKLSDRERFLEAIMKHKFERKNNDCTRY